MDKNQIVSILNEIGLLLEMKGESFFKVRAYYNAARIIEGMYDDIELMVREDKLKDIQGIGSALNQKISELVLTGKLEYYIKLKNEVPEDLFELLRIPGMGPRKVKTLFGQLGITSIKGLEDACIQNKLISLPGFGEKTQERILKGIQYLGNVKGIYLYSVAIEQAGEILKSLIQCKNIKRCCLGGSLRRNKEIVKDIDIIASGENREAIMDFFVSHEEVKDITSRGDTKSGVILKSGIAADIRVVEDYQFPYALHHFTGSKEHHTALRHRAKQMGMKINEYGLFMGDELLRCLDEEELFSILGLAYIEPELREGMGEIEAAERGELPQLIKHDDVKGCFHVHSNYSDGLNSIEELAYHAKKLGYSYIGISDHSKSAGYAGGLTLDDICRQHEEIDRLNEKLIGIKVFKGIECDILSDGRLDYDDRILETFDFVIGSVHSHFTMNTIEMTQRVLKALENKYITILGHPTGRLLLVREGYSIDLLKIIDKAAEKNVVIEINSNPHRLDLDWRFCKYAKERGVLISVEPDAHELKDFKDMRFGINMARKGWLEAKDVLNTKDFEIVNKLLCKN